MDELNNLLHGFAVALTLGNLGYMVIGLLLVAQRQVGYTAARLATDLRLELLRAIVNDRHDSG